METIQPTTTPPVAPQSRNLWPYLLTVLITAIIAVGVTYWITKPANDTPAQPTASSEVVPVVVPTDITATQAEVAVQSIITDKTVHVRYDHMSSDTTKYIVQAYYDYEDRIGTQGWYRVDKATGEVSLIDTVAGETE